MMASLKSSFFREGEHFLLKCELNLILVMMNFGEFQCYLDDIQEIIFQSHLGFINVGSIGSLSYSNFFYIKLATWRPSALVARLRYVVGHKDICWTLGHILSDIRTFLSDIPLMAVFGLLWARGGRQGYQNCFKT